MQHNYCVTLDLMDIIVIVAKRSTSGQETKMPSEEAKTLKLQYQDIPELKETFADSISKWAFDGNTLRIEFAVTRMDRPDDGSGRPVGRSVPACRLVLTANGAVDLLKRCQQLTNALQKAGQVNQAAAQAAPAKAKTTAKTN